MVNREFPYSNQLDGVRAFAVLTVLYTHFWSPFSYFGHWGVQQFFVVSGYLITAILLDARTRKEAGEQDRILSTFFIRRMLRIFPLYYFALAFAWAAHLKGVRETLPWHAFFASNFLFVRNGDWEPWPTAHLWSIATEEQFYLMWAPLVLALPRRAIIPTFIALMIFAIGFRATLVLMDANPVTVFTLMPASLDSLGGGALLAAMQRLRPGGVPMRPLAIAGVSGAVATAIIIAFNESAEVDEIVMESIVIIPMIAIVAHAMRGFEGLPGKVLSHPAVQYFGKLSYGIYLWHMLIVAWLARNTPLLDYTWWRPSAFLFVVGTTCVIAVASFCWYVFERPINRLKRHFPYTVPVVTASGDRTLEAGKAKA